MFEELIPNLLSEAIGILFTVIVLDRLIQWREKKRWEPVKLASYSHLTDMAASMYRHLLPYENRTDPDFVYVFGTESVELLVGIPPSRSPDLFDSLLRDYEQRPDYYREKLEYYDDLFEDFIESRLFLFSEELVGTLLMLPGLFKGTLTVMEGPIPDSLDEDTRKSRMEARVLGIQSILLSAFIILGIMKGKATAIRTLEEEAEKRRDAYSDYELAYRLWHRGRWTRLSVWPIFGFQIIKRWYTKVRRRLQMVTERLGLTRTE